MPLVSINKLFRRSSFLFLVLWIVANSNNVSTESDVVNSLVHSAIDIIGEQSNVGHIRSSNKRSHRMTPVDEALWYMHKRKRPTTQFIDNDRLKMKFIPNSPSSLRSKKHNALPLVDFAWPKPKMPDYNLTKNMLNWTAPVSWEGMPTEREDQEDPPAWTSHNFAEINFNNVSLIVRDFNDRLITDGTMIYGRLTKTVSAPSPSIDIYMKPDEYYKQIRVTNLTVLEGDIIRNGMTSVPCEIINAEIVINGTIMKEFEKNRILVWRGTIPKIQLVPLSNTSKVNLLLQVDKITNVKYIDNTLTHGTATVTIDDKRYINIPFKNINLGNATVVGGKISNVTIARATLFNENSIISGNIIGQTLTGLTISNVDVVGVMNVLEKITSGKILDTVTVGVKTYRNVIIKNVDIIGTLLDKTRLHNVTISHVTLINGHLITNGLIQISKPTVTTTIITIKKTCTTKSIPVMITVAPTKKPKATDTFTSSTISNVTISNARQSRQNGNISSIATARNESYPNVQLKNVAIGNLNDLNGTLPNVTVSIVTFIDWNSIANENIFHKSLRSKQNEGPLTHSTISNITIGNVSANERKLTDGLIIIVTIGNEVKFNQTIPKVTISNVTLFHGIKIISEKTANQFLSKKTGEETFKNITISNVTIVNVVVDKGNIIAGNIAKVILGNETFPNVTIRNVVKGNATNFNGTFPNVTIGRVTLVNGTEITSGIIIDQILDKNLYIEGALRHFTNTNVTISNVSVSNRKITDEIISNVTVGSETLPNLKVTNVFLGNAIEFNGTMPYVTSTLITNGISVNPSLVQKHEHVNITNWTIFNVTIGNVKICEGKVTRGIIDKIVIRRTAYRHIHVANVAIGNATVVDGKLSNVIIINATLVNGNAITSGIIVTQPAIRSVDKRKAMSNLTIRHMTTAPVKINELDRLIMGYTRMAKVTIGNTTYPNVATTNTIINMAKMGDGAIYNATITKSTSITNGTSTTSETTPSSTDENTAIIDRQLSNITLNNVTNFNKRNVSGVIGEFTTPPHTSRNGSHKCVYRVICLISTKYETTTTACPTLSSCPTTSSKRESLMTRVRLTPMTTKGTKYKSTVKKHKRRRGHRLGRHL